MPTIILCFPNSHSQSNSPRSRFHSFTSLFRSPVSPSLPSSLAHETTTEENVHKLPPPHPPTYLLLCLLTLPSFPPLRANCRCSCKRSPLHLCTRSSNSPALSKNLLLFSTDHSYQHINTIKSILKSLSWPHNPSSSHLSSPFLNSKTPQKTYFLII